MPKLNPPRSCKVCNAKFTGRIDKIFCSPYCKADYHYQLKKVTRIATRDIDKILHRNRSSLLEIMGKKSKRKIISKSVLDQKNFKFDYLTGSYENAQGKRYHVVYDFAWMKFSDGKVLIIRRT